MGDGSGSNPLGGLGNLLGSGAQPGGAGGMDLSAATDAVSSLLADPQAMGMIRDLVAEGTPLREALGTTAQRVPAAAPAIQTLLDNPGVLEDISVSMGGFIGGTADGGKPQEVDLSDAGSILGKLFGGDR